MTEHTCCAFVACYTINREDIIKLFIKKINTGEENGQNVYSASLSVPVRFQAQASNKTTAITKMSTPV